LKKPDLPEVLDPFLDWNLLSWTIKIFGILKSSRVL